ncbi:MAG TPA: ABC transporter substrate-binding protein [Candidatus Kapabacteria bacterium]|nr:ABC transporter substrate-binding protein [Candidatus Kapabacteria bacterium]
MSESKTNGISRRSILKTFGAGAAALATTPILTKAEAVKQAALSQSGMKAGIIIPGSAAKTNAAAFLNGIDLFLTTYEQEHGSTPFTPIVETGSGSSSSLLSAFGKLTQHHDVKLVVGYTNSRITHQLSNAIEEAQIPFIEANLGENLFSSKSEYCFHSSLNLWQAHYLLGKYAAEHSGKQAISVGSFYDVGYDAHYAFEAGFVAGGGTVVKQITTGSPADHFSPIEAASITATSEAPVIFLNYSGTDAAVFVSALQRAEGIGSKALYGNGLLSSPHLAGAEKIITASSKGTEAFASLYKSTYGSRATELALLGYETAAMIVSAITKAGRSASGEKLASALSTITFESHRGLVAMNGPTHSTQGPISIHSIGGDVLSVQSIPSSIATTDFKLTDKLHSGTTTIYPVAA